MIDNNIKRFCELIFEIHSLNKSIQKQKFNFYDGGHSFEECNEYDLDRLKKFQEEFKTLLKEIIK